MAIFSGLASLQRHRQLFQVNLIRGKAFQVTDGNGLIQIPAPAFVFTRMRTDPPQHARQGQAFHDKLHRLGILAHFNELDIALDINAGRAGQGAGSPVQFVDGKPGRNGLGIEPIDGFSFGQSQIKGIGE